MKLINPVVIFFLTIGCYSNPSFEVNDDDHLSLSKTIDLKNYGEKSIIHQMKHLLIGPCSLPNIIEVGGITSGANEHLLLVDKKSSMIYSLPLEKQNCGNINSKYLIETESLTDIIYHDDSYFVLDDKLNHIFILDLDLNIVESLLLDSAKSPQKLMIIENNLLVIDPPKNQIILIDLETNNQSIIKSNESTNLWLPQDFTHSSSGHVFILNELGRQILVSDVTFSSSQEIDFAFKDISLLFPKTIQFHPNGLLIIYDAGIRDILFIRPNGELVTTLSTEFSSHKIFPSDFTLLNDESIAIVDRVNQSISIIRVE